MPRRTASLPKDTQETSRSCPDEAGSFFLLSIKGRANDDFWIFERLGGGLGNQDWVLSWALRLSSITERLTRVRRAPCWRIGHDSSGQIPRLTGASCGPAFVNFTAGYTRCVGGDAKVGAAADESSSGQQGEAHLGTAARCATRSRGMTRRLPEDYKFSSRVPVHKPRRAPAAQLWPSGGIPRRAEGGAAELRERQKRKRRQPRPVIPV